MVVVYIFLICYNDYIGDKKMTILLIFLTLTTTAYADDFEVCRGVNCKRYDIYGPEKRGKFLIAPTKESQDKLQSVELNEGDKLPDTLKQVSRVADDLRWQDIRVGRCYYDPEDPTTFYKINDMDSKAKMINYTIEAEDHNNSLTLKNLFFRSSEATSFKKLRTISCSRTPHLSDEKYLSKCIGKRTTGLLLCDFERQF